MDKAEYDQKLKDVQEIEAQTGLEILSRKQSYDKDGKLSEVSYSNNFNTVFRQTYPFTLETTYWVDEQLWNGIVYRDPSR